MVVKNTQTITLDAEKLIEWLDVKSEESSQYIERCAYQAVKRKIEEEMKDVVSSKDDSKTKS
jgi:hypothetical protein